MSRAPYRIREKAVEDLNQIWNHTREKWSTEQADRYYKLLISEIKFIATHFYAGKSIDHVREGYRVSNVKSHLIFYQRGANNIVEIIRILHQRMDIDSRLEE